MFFYNYIEKKVSSPKTDLDYYPFGKTLRSFNGGSKYGHQSSERENELSENDYYTHFRGLDDDIARWKQVDPKMELQYNWSPYVSMKDNPVSNIDPLGDCIPCLLEALEAMETLEVAEEASVASRTSELLAKSARNFEVLKRVASGGSMQMESIEGKDLFHPDVIYAKKQGGAYYDAYLLNRYHPDAYPTLMNAYETIIKSDIRKINADLMKGGGKNGQHANQKAKETAKQKLEEAKEKYNNLKSKPNKTPEDKEELKKAEKEVKHQQKKAQETGENHSQKAKGS